MEEQNLLVAPTTSLYRLLALWFPTIYPTIQPGYLVPSYTTNSSTLTHTNHNLASSMVKQFVCWHDILGLCFWHK